MRYEEAPPIFRAIGDKLGEANVLSALCRMTLQTGQVAEAEKQLEAIVQLRRASHSLYNEGADYGNFAFELQKLNETKKAKAYALQA